MLASKAKYQDARVDDIVATQDLIQNFVLPRITISGVVSNISSPLPGVTVRALSTPYSDVSAGDGTYSVTIEEPGTYDIVASKAEYADVLRTGVDITSDVTYDFTIFRDSRKGCNDDCTKSDGLCHAECKGRGLCGFASEATRSACDLAVPGIIEDPLDSSRQILCCSSPSYAPLKANVRVCGDNVVTTSRPVLFKAQLVNMMVTVFDARECNIE